MCCCKIVVTSLCHLQKCFIFAQILNAFMFWMFNFFFQLLKFILKLFLLYYFACQKFSLVFYFRCFLKLEFFKHLFTYSLVSVIYLTIKVELNFLLIHNMFILNISYFQKIFYLNKNNYKFDVNYHSYQLFLFSICL